MQPNATLFNKCGEKGQPRLASSMLHSASLLIWIFTTMEAPSVDPMAEEDKQSTASFATHHEGPV
jgi:hypothetical protein